MAFELEQPLELVAFGDSLSEITFRVVQWAAASERERELVQKAYLVRPENRNLQALAQVLGVASPLPGLDYTPVEHPSKREFFTLPNIESHAQRLIPRPPQPYLPHPYPLPRSFSGRSAELQILTEWLCCSEDPVLTLVAMGGMGKSALLWHWLRTQVLVERRAGDEGRVNGSPGFGCNRQTLGTAYWDLRRDDARFASFVNDMLLYTVGDTCDLTHTTSLADRTRRLLTLLQHQRYLIILDGFERELRGLQSSSTPSQEGASLHARVRRCADPQVSYFLQYFAAVPMQSRLLIGTRLLPEELDEVAGSQHLPLKSLTTQESLHFFRQRNVPGPTAELAHLSTLCGNHPLSLQLIAGLIRNHPELSDDPQDLLYQEILPKLTSRGPEDIISLAYEALAEPARDLMRRVSAFRGAVNRETLAVVLRDIPSAYVNPILTELVERGLLQNNYRQNTYDLHPLVRAFCYRQLQENDKRPIHSRLAAHLSQKLSSRPAVSISDRLRPIYNLLPDYGMLVAEEKVPTSIEELSPVIELYHHLVQARRYDEALEIMQSRIYDSLFYSFGRFPECIELLRELASDSDDPQPLVSDSYKQCWVLNSLANAYSEYGQPVQCISMLRTALTYLSSRADKEDVFILQSNLAIQLFKVGGLREAHDIWCNLISENTQGEADYARALALSERGRLRSYCAIPGASEDLDLALSIFLRLQHPQAAAICLCYQGMRAFLIEDFSHAVRMTQKAKQLMSGVESDLAWVDWLIGRAIIADEEGSGSEVAARVEEARSLLGYALDRCRILGYVEIEPDLVAALARCERAAGSHQKAYEDANRALLLARHSGYRLKEAEFLLLMAEWSLGDGRSRDARQLARASIDRASCDDQEYRFEYIVAKADQLIAASRAALM